MDWGMQCMALNTGNELWVIDITVSKGGCKFLPYSRKLDGQG